MKRDATYTGTARELMEGALSANAAVWFGALQKSQTREWLTAFPETLLIAKIESTENGDSRSH